MEFDTPWTALKVADAMVCAYRKVEGRAVLSDGGRFSVDGQAIERRTIDAFCWAERFVQDGRDRRILRTWASCMASGESVTARYRGHGWQRDTAERRRRVALASIAAGLNRERAGLTMA